MPITTQNASRNTGGFFSSLGSGLGSTSPPSPALFYRFLFGREPGFRFSQDHLLQRRHRNLHRLELALIHNLVVF
jgi:hypothetical protein